MAVPEQNMAELNTTWWDLLQKITFNLDWSYAALWTLTVDGSRLIWKNGYFHMRSNDDTNAQLFHTLYSSCTFTPGVGFAGHALMHFTNSILWLSGDDLDSLESKVGSQTCFLKAAGIQTIVCLPLGLRFSSYVLELGTVARVRETEELAHNIKEVLLHLLADGLPHLINENPATSSAHPAAHESASDLFRGQMRALYENPQPRSSAGMANETLMESARKYPANVPPLSLEGELLPKAQQRQLGPNVLSELLHSMEPEDTFGRQVPPGSLNAVPPQLSVEIPELAGSTEPSPGDRLTSPWTTESSLPQMEMNAFQSWTSMAEVTSTLDVAFRGLPGSSSATSSRLAGEIGESIDEIGPIIPFSYTLDQFMAADDQQQSLVGAPHGASIRGSSSRSSISLRSQNMEDTEISSGMPESYADCHISELDTIPPGGGATIPGESESSWRAGAQRGSGISSNETSPDNDVSRQNYGIHPRISSATSNSRKQQQRVIELQQHGSSPPGPSQPQRSRRLERRNSTIPEQSPEEDDSKPGPSTAADSKLTLVQFGNILQLGNAAGQVTEALPQEHDEAAVSHMLAERRRRNKQNENFSQLKFLVPSAGKMDKASVLAATIAYIHELKERVKDLEQSNQSLKNQIGADQDQSSTVGPLASTMAKGSPGRPRLRTPNSLSPTDEDKILVSPNGDGNLTIEIRSPCTQSDTAMHIFACLKEMQFKVLNFSVNVSDKRIHANIIVKVKRKNSAGQSAVCAEVEQALTACLNSLG